MEESVFMHIHYIGNDASFWERLKKQFNKTYKGQNLKFSLQAMTDELNSANVCHKVLHGNMDLIFLDFSSDLEKAISIGKLLRKESKIKLKSTIGVHDLLAPKEDITKALLTDIRLNYFKGDELETVVFHAVSFWKPANALEPKYAQAKMKQDSMLFQDLRLIYFKEGEIRIETNSPFEIDEIINVRQGDKGPKNPVVPFKVLQTSESNLFSNSRFAAKIWPSTQEGADHHALIESIRTWHNKQTAPEKDLTFASKRLQILILDSSLDILAAKDFNFEILPFSFNFQSCLHSDMFQVKRKQPHLIAISLDNVEAPPSPEELKKKDAAKKETKKGSIDDTKIDENCLKRIITAIGQMENYQPFIIIFNTKIGKEEWITRCTYERLMAHGGKLEWDLIQQMAKVLAPKLPPLEQDKQFFSKLDVGAVLTCEREVKVCAMDESTLYFISEHFIPRYTVFHIDTPITALVTVVPMNDGNLYSSIKNCYRAFINLIDEKSQQKLRFEINEILFTEKKMKRAEEVEKIEEQKKKYQEEQRLAEAKRIEDEKKAAAEAATKKAENEEALKQAKETAKKKIEEEKAAKLTKETPKK